MVYLMVRTEVLASMHHVHCGRLAGRICAFTGRENCTCCHQICQTMACAPSQGSMSAAEQKGAQ